MIILLAGVSGAGKDTVKKEMLRRIENLISIPSFTTREKRANDIVGVTYYFVSRKEFEDMIQRDEFFEYDEHHENLYGTSKKLLKEKLDQGFNVIKDIDVNGVENLLKIFQGKEKIITIFLKTPKDILFQRLKKRDGKLSEKDIELRLSRFEYEESKSKDYDYIVENIVLENAFNEVERIIREEIKK